MSASKISHFLKECGNGDEWQGVINVFASGIVVGAGATATIGLAGYGVYRLGKWGINRCHQAMVQRNTSRLCSE